MQITFSTYVTSIPISSYYHQYVQKGTTIRVSYRHPHQKSDQLLVTLIEI